MKRGRHWIRQAKNPDRSCPQLEIHGAAAIDGETSDPRQGDPRWVWIKLRNAKVDDAGEPIDAMPGPPVLSIAGPVEDVGHVLVGLLNAYSQLTGVPIEEWFGVAAAQEIVQSVGWDEAPAAEWEASP